MDEDDLLEAIDHNEIQKCVDSLFVEMNRGLDKNRELAARVSAPPRKPPHSAGGRAPSSSQGRGRVLHLHRRDTSLARGFATFAFLLFLCVCFHFHRYDIPTADPV